MQAWLLTAQMQTLKAQADMWKGMMPSRNRVEVVMLKSAIMMMEVMGDGIPEEWGEPTKRTKHLYYWNNISESRDATTVLSDPMWSKLPEGSYFVSWTNIRGTERHHIGAAEKFGMVVSAPRIGDAFEAPYFMPSHDDCMEEEWNGPFSVEKEDNSK
jgi:hypothetical protein